MDILNTDKQLSVLFDGLKRAKETNDPEERKRIVGQIQTALLPSLLEHFNATPQEAEEVHACLRGNLDTAEEKLKLLLRQKRKS